LTSSHTILRLKGKGVKRSGDTGYGDHFVKIKIGMPKRLSRKQEKLIRQYAELEKDTNGTINGVDDGEEEERDGS